MKIVDHEWSVALIEQGHTPILEPNGDLDTCAFAQDIHRPRVFHMRMECLHALR